MLKHAQEGQSIGGLAEWRSEGADGPAAHDGIALDQLLALARRQLRTVAYCVAVTVGLGLLYLVAAVPKYTSTVSVLIDSRRNQDQLSASIAELNFDTGAIDSQLEVILSENVALGVVKALSLETDPEFSGRSGSIFSMIGRGVLVAFDIRGWFTSSDLNTEEERESRRRRIVDVLQANVSVKRLARTYVLAISYTSPNPAKAMAIANAYADAYFADQLQARYEITRRASGWLQDRIAELKSNSLKTDLAVQRFKAENGIISSGTFLVSEQQMAEVTTQISVARSDTARALARLQQIRDILKSGKADGAVTESLGNPIINDLRSKYLRASKSAAELTARVGDKHFQVVSLRNEMKQYERLIFDELGRIAETYVAEVDVARARESSLNEAMTSQIGQRAASNEVMVSLRELERESDTFKNLYQTFLQRYQDAIQRESFPTSEARVITPASRSDRPSSPKALLTLAVSLLLGLMSGAIIGGFLVYRDRVFRIGQQVREQLGLDMIGMLPALPDQAQQQGRPLETMRHIDVSQNTLRYVLDAPLSNFAETLRSAKVEVDLAIGRKKTARVIGILSVLPHEGKTTVAKNFASLLALLGAKTLLIDGDLRNPGLSRNIASHAPFGLLEILRGERQLSEALLIEPETGLFFLPSVVRKRVQNSSEFLSSEAMRICLAKAALLYDYIVVDLPPVGPVVDVRAAASLFDGFLFVIEWGKTARRLVKNTLFDDPILYEKCIGVLLNKVNADKLRLYDTEGEKSAYYGRYGGYYVDRPASAAE